ncbi:hypothetical protein [Chromobacterium alticapitis]|uniref:hypothetical protein n=1 Tax=Chromobacterium alticapitis TaxID=2073169 RepID=UPI001304B563|nr:hypothetical protein [Chromobacterium alticapitis]
MKSTTPLILCAALALSVCLAMTLRNAPLSLACHVGQGGMHVAAHLAVLRLELHVSWPAGAAA